MQKSNEWLMFSDSLNLIMKERQEYMLYNYQKYMPVLFYTLFSTVNQQKSRKLKYPHVQYEVGLNF